MARVKQFVGIAHHSYQKDSEILLITHFYGGHGTGLTISERPHSGVLFKNIKIVVDLYEIKAYKQIIVVNTLYVMFTHKYGA